MKKDKKIHSIGTIHTHRFHEDERRRGFYDVIPDLRGDMNFSHMQAGIIAGMHLHKKQTDYFTVISGSVLFRLVTKNGKEERIVLSSHSRKTLVIPPGIWHGYRSLETSILLFYIDQKFNINDELRKPTKPLDWEIPIK